MNWQCSTVFGMYSSGWTTIVRVSLSLGCIRNSPSPFLTRCAFWSANLVTNSIFFCQVFIKYHWFASKEWPNIGADVVLYRSFQQLPRLSIGSLKGFRKWHGTLQVHPTPTHTQWVFFRRFFGNCKQILGQVMPFLLKKFRNFELVEKNQ